MGQRIKSEEVTAKGAKIADAKITKVTQFLMSGMVEQARVTDGAEQFHTLGLDLAGSLTAAGGVGAVLASTEYLPSQSPDQQISKSFNYLYDGNGNVTASCNDNGVMTAKLAYSPFGQKTSGTDLPFEFSSKSKDASGLIYYGHRFYAPTLGRWLTKDPIGEVGGENLYAMLQNKATNNYDYLGLSLWTDLLALGWPPLMVAWMIQHITVIYETAVLNNPDVHENGPSVCTGSKPVRCLARSIITQKYKQQTVSAFWELESITILADVFKNDQYDLYVCCKCECKEPSDWETVISHSREVISERMRLPFGGESVSWVYHMSKRRTGGGCNDP
jgi:RHS repeat-associated protein